MIKKIPLHLFCVMIGGIIHAQDNSNLLDSTIKYHFYNDVDSVKNYKSDFETYNSSNQITHISGYSYQNNLWESDAITDFVYDLDGNLLSSTYLSVEGDQDLKKEYIYANSVLTKEIDYKNINAGTGISPEWVYDFQKTFNYDLNNVLISITEEAYLGYWQEVSFVENTYLNDQLIKDERFKDYTTPPIKVYSNLYSTSSNGTVYESEVYDVNVSSVTDDLADIYIPLNTEFLNVYSFNGVSNVRYDLTGVAGKLLSDVINGDNNNGTVIDIASLRTDYFEWFKTDDEQVTLINCNIIARSITEIDETIEVAENLTSTSGQEGGNYVLENTALFVKFMATDEDLQNIVFTNDIDYVNIYTATDPTDSGAKNGRIDVESPAGKSLKQIFDEEGISISDLAFNYYEWFENDDYREELVKLNIKAVSSSTLENISVYDSLSSDGATDQYLSTAYKISSDATMDELANFTFANDVDFVNIYQRIGLTIKRTDLTGVAGKTIKAVLNGDNNEGERILLSTLRDNYREAFYNKEGIAVLVNLNIKAVHILGQKTPVIVSDSLYTSGSDEQLVTSYLLQGSVTMNDLASYTLSNIDFINVYTYNGVNNVRYTLHGVTNKSLQSVLEGSNDEGKTIDLDSLRYNYREWFNDKDGDYTLVNLNIKAVETIDDVNVVIESDSLYSKSDDLVFENTAYLVKSSANLSDLSTYILESDIEYVNVYTNDGNKNIRYDLSGVAGKSLEDVLNGNNNENKVISLDSLREYYVEWFKNNEDRATLENLNIKAVKTITNIKVLIESNNYSYQNNQLSEQINKHYDGSINQNLEGNIFKTDFVYNNSDGLMLKEVSVSTDAVSYTPSYKNEYLYDINNRLHVDIYSIYSLGYVLADKTYYYYDEDIDLGIFSNNDSDIILKLYPNPVNTNMTIIAENIKSFNYVVYNINGLELVRGYSDSKELKLNVENFDTGIYFIQINSNQFTTKTKFIKD